LPVRFVLDTNVVVAAFRSRRGASNALLRHAEAGRVRVLCSTALFLEYEAVLGRRETRASTGHSPADVRAVMNALAAVAEPVDLRLRTRPLLRDADDEMVLETAANGNADAIVTHNVKDFLPAERLGIEVVTPGAIVRKLRR
jgi:putative PIN family toxin of toxin-antitoxin system